MARRFSKSQLQSKLRQAQTKQRQAINRINQGIRKRNRAVQSAVNKYNGAVRAHNARVRSNRQRLQRELNRLRSCSATTTRYVTFRASVHQVHDAYERYDSRLGDSPEHALALDLAEREDANNVAVLNALLDEGQGIDDGEGADIQETKIVDELRGFSPELHARWEGALYALGPRNPDACRQFCTSSREILTHLVNLRAPTDEVLRSVPSCDTDQNGRPTRAARIRYVLASKGMDDESLEVFAEENIESILELFKTLNSGTHGEVGKFGLVKLRAIKARVEDGLLWMSHILS